MSGCLLLARRGGREVVSGGSLAFGQKRGDWLEAWEEQNIYQKGGGAGLLACFWPWTGAATVAFFNKENRVRFFCLPSIFISKIASFFLFFFS
jgi:hypothetical protein